jgi:hypothetical protein
MGLRLGSYRQLLLIAVGFTPEVITAKRPITLALRPASDTALQEHPVG